MTSRVIKEWSREEPCGTSQEGSQKRPFEELMDLRSTDLGSSDSESSGFEVLRFCELQI